MGVKEVAAGAEWLDENKPGWERRIDPSVLDIEHGCHCVIGQLDGSYHTFGFGPVWAADHGFLPSADYCWTDEQARSLESSWVELIKERFDTGNLSDLR